MPSSPGSSESGQPPPDGRTERSGAEGSQATTVQSPGPPPAGGTTAGEGGRTPTEAQLDAEIARMDDRYKRALADLDNYRKRSAREVERRVRESREALIRDWLEVVDSVERALRMEQDTANPLYQGLRAVLDQMETLLARHGVRRVGEAGEPFDPERHDAVDVRVTDEVPDRTVLQVLRSGFALGDRILRPAQVVVSRRAAPEQ
ncbi:MAG: molecular chaperone GrpE [Solirubrobacteraceae bacterium]|jgi:molecular chaperone GrpE|nr:molecular chaperone GrpE [Solirubrobacteraceae bacterium]